jgi:hypothetical protein
MSNERVRRPFMETYMVPVKPRPCAHLKSAAKLLFSQRCQEVIHSTQVDCLDGLVKLLLCYSAIWTQASPGPARRNWYLILHYMQFICIYIISQYIYLYTFTSHYSTCTCMYSHHITVKLLLLLICPSDTYTTVHVSTCRCGTVHVPQKSSLILYDITCVDELFLDFIFLFSTRYLTNKMCSTEQGPYNPCSCNVLIHGRQSWSSWWRETGEKVIEVQGDRGLNTVPFS